MSKIKWQAQTPIRWQGFQEVSEGLLVRVLLIQHTISKHWCGYGEFPHEGLPTPDKRLYYNQWCSEYVTFFGPSGPIITWMNRGMQNADLIIPAAETLSTYWFGFDLPVEVSVENAAVRLEAFVQSFYDQFLLGKDEES